MATRKRQPDDPIEDPQQALADADPEAVARNIALRRLTAAPQTRHQLEEALARRRVPEDVAQIVLDRMTEVGLVDDAAYAVEYVRVRRAVRSLSKRALAMELHDWWIGYIGKELALNARLSADDLALLRLHRQGQCTKLIADALGTSPHAVNSRFQRLTEKLGVPNRRVAANMAAEYGLIS